MENAVTTSETECHWQKKQAATDYIKHEEFLQCMSHFFNKSQELLLSLHQINDEVLPRRAALNRELLLLMLCHASSKNNLLCSRSIQNPNNGVQLTAKYLIHNSSSFESLLEITYAFSTR